MADVEVLPAKGKGDLGGRTKCDATSVVADFDVPPKNWADVLRVDTVRSDTGRRLHVEHESRRDDLDAGHPESGAFSGTAVSGKWLISSPYLAGEVCGNPEHHPPAILALEVGTRCEEDAR